MVEGNSGICFEFKSYLLLSGRAQKTLKDLDSSQHVQSSSRLYSEQIKSVKIQI